MIKTLLRSSDLIEDLFNPRQVIAGKILGVMVFRIKSKELRARLGRDEDISQRKWVSSAPPPTL